jgi:hypothetical protein
VPTDGTRLPILRSGDFGRSPFFGQLSAKQFVDRARTLRRYYPGVCSDECRSWVNCYRNSLSSPSPLLAR